MSEYPRMLYRVGDAVELQDGRYDTLIVADEVADAEARAAGWCVTPGAAREAAAPQPEPPAARPDPAEDSPPTRAELEQKARELGIKFDGRWGDRKLSAAIAAAVKE